MMTITATTTTKNIPTYKIRTPNKDRNDYIEKIRYLNLDFAKKLKFIIDPKIILPDFRNIKWEVEILYKNDEYEIEWTIYDKEVFVAFSLIYGGVE